MEAQKVVLPNGKTATLAASPVLTPLENQAPKVVEASNCRVVVFFIGGAGDKAMSSTLEIIHKYHIISAQISAWEKPF
ncbi:hypothetical protein ACSMFT_11690 [Ectopseudomonas oleovorans]|mgnify:CR=1 FL=1|uniref:hypothetical protein n=1 Tax=Ectopseudomonas oleovorans TaxID=301 RepID=UPI003F1B4D90